jgi:gluconate 2-dehydrogenase gamma chain
MSDPVSRKDFVAIIGTATAAVAVPNAAQAAQAAPMEMAANTAQPGGMAPLGDEPEAYIYFTEPESAFVEATVERLIPTDALGPGARSAGVAFFIDQQLAGAFGTAAKMYRNGPWGAAPTPMQGYQLRQTPAELYRQAIMATEAYCNKTYQSRFAALTSAQQDDVLKGLDGGTITFENVPAKAFFEMLLQNTIEGFFADPLYGGNRDKAGWKLVGFPGVAAYYANKITDYNKPYTVPPMSIADVQQGRPAAAGHELMHHMAMENAERLNKVNQ